MPHRRRPAVASCALVLACVALLGPGCGGATGGVTVMLAGDPLRDGRLTQGGIVYASPGVQKPPAIAGHGGGGLPLPVVRGFFSFDYAPIRDVRISVISAYLWIYESGPIDDFLGGLHPPQEEFGSLLLDHVQHGDLDDSDFDTPALHPAIASLASFQVFVMGEYKVLNVTDAVRDDLANGRPHAQFRVRFSNEMPPVAGPDALEGGVAFTDGEHAQNMGGPGPMLFITYAPRW
jgi:hypothetical protein